MTETRRPDGSLISIENAGAGKNYGPKGYTTSAAGLGSWKKKNKVEASATPTPSPTPTARPTPKISTPMDESITQVK